MNKAKINRLANIGVITDGDKKYEMMQTKVRPEVYARVKRIMKLNNQGKDDEYIEKNFQPTLKDLTWHLIKEQLSDQLEIKVEQPDVLETAKAAARAQFEQYGMMNVPDDVLTNYANKMLENKEQAEGLVSRAVENKIAQKAKDAVKLNKKSVTLAEFNKLLEPVTEQ